MHSTSPDELGRMLRWTHVPIFAGVGLWVWDIPGNRIWTTLRCREMFGLVEPEGITFEMFASFVHHEDRSPLSEAVQSAFSGSGQYDCEYRIVRTDGKLRWISARGEVEFSEGGEPLMMRGALVDTTPHRSAQQELERHRFEVAHLGRVASMGELTSTIAHELNRPLAAILANAQAARRFLISGRAEETKQLAILDDIIQDDKRAAEVVHRLRAMARKEPAEREFVCLHEVIRHVSQVLKGELAAHRSRLELELGDELPV